MDPGVFAVMIIIIQVAADEGARVSVRGTGGVGSSCLEVLSYPHRDHIGVAPWWPTASLLKGVITTVNCTRLPVRTMVSEKNPETLEWNHLGS